MIRIIRSNPIAVVLGATLIWGALYAALPAFATWGVRALGLDEATPVGEAFAFFLYDAPKVILLLAGVVFVMGFLNTFIAPDRVRALLAARGAGGGNVIAALFGIVTPFCSCSAVPLFIGFVQAGVPLGVTFSFLISAPMINEVALALLFGLFGARVALLYLGLGLAVAIVSGMIIGRLRLDHLLQDWVRDLAQQKSNNTTSLPVEDVPAMTFAQRAESAGKSVVDIVGKVWPFLIVGVAAGAGIHGYVPQDMMAGIMGREAWWSVPLAILIGVPMYANAAGILPVVQALLAKGAALGTVLAFMMSVVALSLPEMLILTRVLKWQLIAVFVAIVSTGILLVGVVFNLVL